MAVELAVANSGEARFSPDYTPNYETSTRDLASTDSSDSGSIGCGRVKKVYKAQNEKMKSGEIGLKETFMTIILFMPFALIAFIRSRISHKRQYERYRVNFNGALYDASGEKVDVKVCTFSIGGAGVQLNLKKENFEGQKNLVLIFTTRSGDVKTYSCRAVSSYKNQIGLCFEL